MRPTLLTGYTRILGRSQGYTGLPIKDETVSCSVGGDVPCMTSEYELTVDEIQHIIEGGRIRLQIQGTQHPPVLLSVTDPIEAILS